MKAVLNESLLKKNQSVEIKEALLMKDIKLGIAEDITTSFENLICPYCHTHIDWDIFYSAIDLQGSLSTDKVTTNEYECPYCHKQMRIYRNVLINAQKAVKARKK